MRQRYAVCLALKRPKFSPQDWLCLSTDYNTGHSLFIIVCAFIRTWRFGIVNAFPTIVSVSRLTNFLALFWLFLLYVWLFSTLSNLRNAYSFVDHSQQYTECVWPAVFVLHLCIRLRHLLDSPVMIHICWRNSYPTTYHSFCCGLLYSDCLFSNFVGIIIIIVIVIVFVGVVVDSLFIALW